MRYLWILALLWTGAARADDLELVAPLQPAVTAEVVAAMSGRIRCVCVAEGDRVAAGDTLALLDGAALRLTHAAADLNYRKIRDRLDRAEQIAARGLISAQQLETLRCDAEAARIRRQQVRLDLSRTAVLSPMTGLIAECAVREGDPTSPSTRLFRVIKPDDLTADLFIPPDRLDGLTPGQKATASPVRLPDLHLPGHIARISPIIDPDSGTCRVIAIFPGAGTHVRPGTLANITLQKTEDRRQKTE